MPTKSDQTFLLESRFVEIYDWLFKESPDTAKMVSLIYGIETKNAEIWASETDLTKMMASAIIIQGSSVHNDCFAEVLTNLIQKGTENRKKG